MIWLRLSTLFKEKYYGMRKGQRERKQQRREKRKRRKRLKARRWPKVLLLVFLLSCSPRNKAFVVESPNLKISSGLEYVEFQCSENHPGGHIRISRKALCNPQLKKSILIDILGSSANLFLAIMGIKEVTR